MSEKTSQAPEYTPNVNGMPQPGYPAGTPSPGPNINVMPPQSTAAMIGQEYQANMLAKCAQGQHARETKYGMCGIITAIACFPFGLICLLTDRSFKCSRCGEALPK